jgi:hypothetical protein
MTRWICETGQQSRYRHKTLFLSIYGVSPLMRSNLQLIAEIINLIDT